MINQQHSPQLSSRFTLESNKHKQTIGRTLNVLCPSSFVVWVYCWNCHDPCFGLSFGGRIALKFSWTWWYFLSFYRLALTWLMLVSITSQCKFWGGLGKTSLVNHVLFKVYSSVCYFYIHIYVYKYIYI